MFFAIRDVFASQKDMDEIQSTEQTYNSLFGDVSVLGNK